jgi:hypothetical protein
MGNVEANEAVARVNAYFGRKHLVGGKASMAIQAAETAECPSRTSTDSVKTSCRVR